MIKLPCYISSCHMACMNDWIACLEKAHAAGFDGVELFGGENGVRFADLPEERCMAVARRAKELNMRISYHPWEEWHMLEQEEMIRNYTDMVARCLRMGIKEINMHMYFLATREQGMERLYAATDACLEMLKAHDAVLLYEDVPDHDFRELGSEAQEFAALFAHYGPETPIGLNIDSGHAYIMHQIQPLAQDFADRWCYTHIHDNNGLADEHSAPGDGTLPFDLFAAEAAAAGYQGVLMMEFHESGLERGMPILKKAYAAAGYELAEIK